MKSEEYRHMYNAEDAHWWYRGLRGMLRQAWAQSAPSTRLRVLDVGCGTGANLSVFNETAEAVGIDYSMDPLDLCKDRGVNGLAAASALELPFAPGSFDVVVSCDVLCHQGITDPRIALREMARVLRPGGHILLNVPAYQWLMSSHDREVATTRRFTRAEVVRILRDAGFEPRRTTYWNTLLFPAAVGVRVWRKFFPIEGSDLTETPSALTNRVCGAMLAVERCILRLTTLAFGVSVFAVARKHTD
ncbi:MAG: class I SAM-dependent methyltransferase [bacterium]|nr:class I SAM-dependent methyltransferase [bacterium]